MKYSFNAIWCLKAVLLLGTLILSACITTPQETKIIKVENQKWRITAVGVHQVDEGWLVSGKLSSPDRFGLPRGHVLIAIMDKEGAITQNKEVQYQKIVAINGVHKRHQFGRALFSANFKYLPKNSVVIATFEIDNLDETN